MLNLTPGTGPDSQAEATLDKTKSVQQQEAVRDHRKRLRVTLVVGEMIFKIYEHNIQPRDGTRGPVEAQKEEDLCQIFLQVILKANGVGLDLW